VEFAGQGFFGRQFEQVLGDADAALFELEEFDGFSIVASVMRQFARRETPRRIGSSFAGSREKNHVHILLSVVGRDL
jgi:hypothetical protein